MKVKHTFPLLALGEVRTISYEPVLEIFFMASVRRLQAMKKEPKTFSIFEADKDKKDVYYKDHAVVQCATPVRLVARSTRYEPH